MKADSLSVALGIVLLRYRITSPALLARGMNQL